MAAVTPAQLGAPTAPSFVGEAPALTFEGEQEASPQFNIGEPDVSYAAEPMGEEDALFAAPLPPQAPREPERPAPPPAPRAGSRTSAGPAASAGGSASASPAGAPRRSAEPAKPDYHTELPSIPVEREPEAREFPTLRPSARPAAPILLGLPQVAVERQPQPAELAQDRGPRLLDGRHVRAGIAVDVDDVADALVGPAAGVVDQAASGRTAFDPRPRCARCRTGPSLR